MKEVRLVPLQHIQRSEACIAAGATPGKVTSLRHLVSVMLAALALASCHARPADPGQTVRYAARSASPPSLAERNSRLLALHNQARSSVGAPALVWDATLAEGAAGWAARLGDSGMLEHSGAEDLGENLWMGTADYYSLDAMVGGWTEEQRDFRPGRFPDVSRSGDWSAVGHYTQMIWRDTRAVGCGLYHGRQWDVLVCRYSPAGNVMGDQVP